MCCPGPVGVLAVVRILPGQLLQDRHGPSSAKFQGARSVKLNGGYAIVNVSRFSKKPPDAKQTFCHTGSHTLKKSVNDLAGGALGQDPLERSTVHI